MHLNDIIIKYLENSATEEEVSILLQWLEESDENKTKFKETYDLWLYSNAALADDTDVETALSRLRQKTIYSSKKKISKQYTLSQYFLRIAACILLLLSAGYAGYTFKDTRNETPIVMNKLLTGANCKGEFILPDGSKVWLNANSTLEYPETFIGEKRIVTLKGEALFEVEKNPKFPFLVQADRIDIEVLGTRFLVQNYPNKTYIETVLVEGSIKVGGSYFPESPILVPGQLISYNRINAQKNIRTVKSADYINWINPKLVFDNTSLADIIINLEKWYGVEISASPEFVENVYLSFTIRRESLEEVLKFMSITAPIIHYWDNDILYLSSKKQIAK